MGGTDTVIGAERLFRAHSGFIKAFLYRLGLTNLWIDDAVQEVFLIAHSLGGYSPGPAAAKTWLGEIALRVASNARRRQRTLAKVVAPQADLLDLLRHHHASSRSPDDEVAERELLEQVHRALTEMTERHRDVFLRFYMHGEDCGVIASTLHIPIGTVYSRLHMARQRFIENLTQPRQCSRTWPVRASLRTAHRS